MNEVIHVFSEQDSKGSLLAEIRRLQSSLAAMRQARDFHGANSAYLMQERDRLQKEIEEMSKLREEAPALDGQWHSPSVVTTGNLDHLKMQEAPAPVDVGLVERMLIAWAHGDGDIKLDAINVRRMTAALRVAADELLGPVTDAEAKDWSRDEWGVRYLYQNGVNELLAARRARLLAPAKSAEERVTVQYAPTPQKADPQPYRVYLDGEDAGEHFSSGDHAQIYRLGLIATLKQEGAK